MTQPIIFADLFNIANYQDQIPWEAFRPGVEIYWLYRSAASTAQAAILRYQPGASVPLHDHLGYEHIIVLSGSQRDRKGEYPTGTLIINPPASDHQVTSPEGCIVLIIWEKPVLIHEEVQT